MRTIRDVVVSALVLVLTCTAAWAQATAELNGRVTDESGAVLPGVTVTATQTATGFMRTVATDEAGTWSMPNLPIGPYRLEVSLQGFRTYAQTGIVLQVDARPTINAVLAVGNLEETVSVEAAAPLVDVRSAGISTVVEQERIVELPLQGRQVTDLIVLAGAAVETGRPNSRNFQGGVNISVAGGLQFGVAYTLDGAVHNDPQNSASLPLPFPDALQEFRVATSGLTAQSGMRSAASVNAVTKSGTNTLHGNLFEFLRDRHFNAKSPFAAVGPDGKKFDDGLKRNQFGGTVGGPITRDRTFYFLAFEGIRENLMRPNLSEAIGTPCPVTAPTLAANEALINAFGDCQRLALINFFKTTRNQDEGQPVQHTANNNALLAKADWNVSARHNLSASYNFDYSKNRNQTFDVPTYGTSANGTEGPSKINVANMNLFSTLSSTALNELHVTVSREDRPRSATDSNIPADTGIGADPAFPSFRFGNPFFLAPNVDETMKRFQVKDNYSLILGRHTVKAGGEWIHSNNTQVFRGFFEGRYLFSSVSGFLRYASPAGPGGFGPNTVACTNGIYVTAPTPCPGTTTTAGGPLLFYLQSSSPDGIARDAAGASDISNEEYAFFVQDRWQAPHGVTLDYGLRWEAQTMPKTVDPATTAFAPFLGNPGFPSDGTIPSQWNQWQPRGGVAWDVGEKGKTVIRASGGLFYARQNMLSQVGSVTTNGIQQKSDFRDTTFTAFADMPVWPNLLTPSAVTPGTFPLFTGIRVFDSNYQNPKVFSFNTGFERQIMPSMAVYADFTYAKGMNLTRFLNYNTHGSGVAAVQPPNRDTTAYAGANPFNPALGDVFVTNSQGRSSYRGLTVGARKRMSQNYQFEANYVLAKDEDDDSNERDPFTDRSFNFYDLSQDYGPSDRDIRHKFNFFSNMTLPHLIAATVRMQARSAQPITTSGYSPAISIWSSASCPMTV